MKKLLFAGMIVMGTFAFAACESKTETTEAETTDTTALMETEAVTADTAAMTADTTAADTAAAQ